MTLKNVSRALSLSISISGVAWSGQNIYMEMNQKRKTKLCSCETDAHPPLAVSLSRAVCRRWTGYAQADAADDEVLRAVTAQEAGWLRTFFRNQRLKKRAKRFSQVSEARAEMVKPAGRVINCKFVRFNGGGRACTHKPRAYQ